MKKYGGSYKLLFYKKVFHACNNVNIQVNLVKDIGNFLQRTFKLRGKRDLQHCVLNYLWHWQY